MDVDLYLRFLVALAFVLALIALLTWAAKRFGWGGALAVKAGPEKRLSVVEVRVLDSRRKLVLIRRDEREHLILIGPGQDLLVESGIAARAMAAPAAPQEKTA